LVFLFRCFATSYDYVGYIIKDKDLH